MQSGMHKCLLAVLLLAAHCCALDEKQIAATSGADPIALWKDRANSVAKVVEEALSRQDKNKSVEVKHVDMESLRIWHGQRLELALEVDSNLFTFFIESEPEWHSLADACPSTSSQVGPVVPKADWDVLERNWVAPISQGPLLPDFTLEGPLDLYLIQPTALQLFLPHPVDVERLTRVLLRDGACVTVRGARSVGLRRPVDLPSLSLGDFASLVTADAEEHPEAGILHLLSGVRSAAVQRWNVTHPDLSLAAVSLELEFSPQSGTLLAAPLGSGRGLQRLKSRKLKEGVVELVPREQGFSEEESKALALTPGAPYAWPIRSMHPQHLQAYERLLREVLSSQVFSSTRMGGSQGPRRDGGSGGSGGGLRLQPDLQLRLHKTQAEAMTLLQLRVEVERRLKVAAGAAEGATESGEPSSRKDAAAAGGEGSADRAMEDLAAAGEEVEGARLATPPDTLAVLVQPEHGPHEAWDALVQVKQDAKSGALRFVPVRMEQAVATRQTVSFSPAAVMEMVGNFSGAALQELADRAAAEEHEEL